MKRSSHHFRREGKTDDVAERTVFHDLFNLYQMKHPAGTPSNNPFGASEPNQVLCIESRPLPTQQDGTVWIYLAMDAYSRYAFHHTIKGQSILPEYISFLMEVYKKHPALKTAKLAVDTEPAMTSAFSKVFPDAHEVICDKNRVNVVTEDFHIAFLAHLAQLGRSN